VRNLTPRAGRDVGRGQIDPVRQRKPLADADRPQRAGRQRPTVAAVDESLGQAVIAKGQSSWWPCWFMSHATLEKPNASAGMLGM
jgi:hypothetical protein